ncbi:MAG: aminotransferase class III-fold pyridoxal phosphate-dependent enzyme, partial [Clostridiales bacterium]|nr:aminotransferase class III-fold pyridoxal phosphate-dependent enzyme [Clostridiales bacterium]
ILLENDSKLIKECASKGDYFRDKLEKLQNIYPHIIVAVKGKGLMLGAQLDGNIDGENIVSICLDKGFIINCAGNNTLRFVPPLIITKDEIDKLIATLNDIFKLL